MDLDKIAGVEPPVDEAAVEAEIARYLGDDEPRGPVGVVPAEPWRITSIGAAEWAMVKVAEIRRREVEYDDQIELWRDAKRRMAGAADFLEERLQEWAVSNRTDRVKAQHLAHGTVQTRKQNARIGVWDEALVIKWAQRVFPDAVETKLVLSKQMLDQAKVWRIADVPVGFRAINRETGEVQEVPYDMFGEVYLDAAMVAERMPGYDVTAITEQMVLDESNYPVPGTEVVAERVTATVRPLGI